ncbi:hypothetical protein PACTADRAFT_51418 [Pachysolen tannophilus NRRL Y-2460]|uniref:Small-subunit processome Utp12 domain-containing protein n=1 Tax=Pachysolen tannophilus NRRL Y-2460 TaxID=669874 RepID=A0A1E4TPF5_PACTA|nr:hypothetical protein PACTADRAFT_51418 [Pachysolen tannophilus NRRL Y-2460]
MKSDFKFSNLLGTVYRQGNIVFTDDGTKLLSPVGNRISCFDLINNKSFTFSFEHRKNVSRIALNKQGTLLLSVDEDGRAILVNFISKIVLHHFNFKEKVLDLQFSPCGKFFSICCGRFIQVWKTPDFSEDRQFQPFVRHRIYSGHYNDVISITWSRDSRFFISTSKDMTARIFSIDSKEKEATTMTFGGHHDVVIKAFFDKNQEIIYTVSKDGALFKWEYTEGKEDETTSKPSWRITAKNYFFSEAKLKCATFHPQSDLLVVGFTNGEFRIYQLPDFALIQQLSMGQNEVNTVEINKSGEWLAFGSSKLGQLLVYEWQSESYILKQQGHFDSMNCLAYSPDGSRIVTASDDGKIKIWDILSGFCLATFEEHSSSVTAVQFAKRGNVLFSASLDGTVRAYDLIRYRNFRTFTATERVQFSCLAVDPSGEVVCAGSLDSFEIFVWSVQTSQLLDSLAGHEGPISCLAFGTENSTLASASWDKTVRVWNIFGRSQHVEPFNIYSDVLCLAMRPDSKEVAVSTLDGHLQFWNIEDAKQVGDIDGRRDILSGRFIEDRFVAKNSARSKYFTTINYSFDGLTLVAAGNNNSICLYDIPNSVLLKRFTVSLNMAINGTLEYLNSKNLTDAGPLDLIDRDGENSDLEDRIDLSLPGSNRGDPSLRKTRAQIRVTSISFSPTAAAFAAASTEGLLIYSVDDELIFDPFDLDVDITPETTLQVLQEKEYLNALIMSLRLNEVYLIHKVYESIPVIDIKLIVSQIPHVFLPRFLKFVTELSLNNPHLEFNIIWIKALLDEHGMYINSRKRDFISSLRLIQRLLNRTVKEIVKCGNNNSYLIDYFKLSNNIKSTNVEQEDTEEEYEVFEDAEDNTMIVDAEEDEEDAEDAEDADEDEDDGGWFGPNGTQKLNVDAFGSSDDESE